MPTPPLPYEQLVSADRVNKESSSSAPQSPGNQTSETEQGKQNAMVGRLMGDPHDWRRHVETEDRRESRRLSHDQIIPPVQTSVARLPGQVAILPSPRISHHVAEHGSEQSKKDVSENNTNTPAASTETTSPIRSRPHIPSTSSESGQIGKALTAQLLRASLNVVAAAAASNSFEIPQTSAKETMSIGNADEKIANVGKKKSKRSPKKQAGQSTGRWTREEHQAFLEGLKECGREWKKVAQRIPTRTSAQIRSHAQKYFAKIQREQEHMGLPENAITSVPMESLAQITPSIQRNIEELLSNPEEAQRRVENTLEALRERYRQLQLRLDRRREQRRSRQSKGSLVENDGTAPTESRKRSYEEMTELQRKRIRQSDENSSVSSNLSTSMASLGNEELIALHALTGALPRGDSSVDETTTKDDDTDDGTKPSSPTKGA